MPKCGICGAEVGARAFSYLTCFPILSPHEVCDRSFWRCALITWPERLTCKKHFPYHRLPELVKMVLFIA